MLNKGFGKAARLLVLLIVVAATLTTGAIAAETPAPASLFELLEPHVAGYNDYIANVPGMVKQLFGGERINVHISLAGGEEEVIGIVTSTGDAAVVEFVAGGLENPTLRVYIDEAVIQNHLANPVKEDIIATILNLRIEGVGLSNQVQVVAFNLIQRVVNAEIINRIITFFQGLF